MTRIPGSRYRAVRAAIVVAATGTLLIALTGIPVGGQQSPQISRDDEETCLACHSAATEKTPPVDRAALARSPHSALKCQDCHASITSAPHTPSMLKDRASCAACHVDQSEAYNKSAHRYPDKKPGDHPTCVTCHGGGDPHGIRTQSRWPRADKVALCSSCHADAARMRRYGPDADAVPSYRESFHGKALLRYGNLKVAICTDCHGHHGVLSPEDPAAPTNRTHAAATCGQAGCHVGARVNFAMSGANHLRLKLKQSGGLRLEEGFFRFLTVGTLIMLLLGVAFDLRAEVFGKTPPASGRPTGIAISLAFLSVVVALGMAYFGVSGLRWPILAAIVLIGIGVALLTLRPRPPVSRKDEKRYSRFTVVQRLQHVVLAISFTLLVLTGMPLRYPDAASLRGAYVLFGGLAVLRVVHRVAAVLMIAGWIWHTLYLIYRWWKAGFKLSSWTMFPTMKDVGDFLKTVGYYLGQEKEEPKYDRFQFREKFDYFAVYWGMPIMVLSGLVLWFPIALGNLLPDWGLSAAYIAHSDEAVLAFLAILMWHFYNTHFHPEHFPMSPVWLTGSLTESEMAREHPLELERIKAAREE